MSPVKGDHGSAKAGPLEALQPSGWPQPKGYANAMMGRGRMVLLAGQIGWNERGQLASGFVAQAEQALRNILTVVAEAGGGPEHIGRLTWYVTDIESYRAGLSELGRAYRKVFGRVFPAMTLVQVVRLVEPAALVEIEATAILPDER